MRFGDVRDIGKTQLAAGSRSVMLASVRGGRAEIRDSSGPVAVAKFKLNLWIYVVRTESPGSNGSSTHFPCVRSSSHFVCNASVALIS